MFKIALIISSLAVGAADAATFNFVGGSGSAPSLNFTSDDGVKVTVTSSDVASAPTATGGSTALGIPTGVNRGPVNGLGVWWGTGDDAQVDGVGRDDMLIFTFDRKVTLTSLTLSLLDSGDSFSVFGFGANGAGSFGELGKFNTNFPAPHGTKTFSNFGQTFTGTTFGIAAKSGISEFRIAGLSATPTPTSAPVPLSAPALLMLGGVAALAGFRRRG